MEEEIKCTVRVKKLLAVVENFFEGKNSNKIHELGFYYMVEPENLGDINLEDHIIIENDEGLEKKLEFKWFNLTELKDVNFKPIFLKDKLYNKDYEFIHFIIKQ